MPPRKLRYLRIEDQPIEGSDPFERLPIEYQRLGHWLDFCRLLENQQIPEFELLTADFQFDADPTTPKLWPGSPPLPSAPNLRWHPALRQFGVTSGILMASTLAGMAGNRDIPAGAAVHTAIKDIVKQDVASTMLVAQIMLLCGESIDASETFRLLEATIDLVQREPSHVWSAFVKACKRFRSEFLRRCGSGTPSPAPRALWIKWESIAQNLTFFEGLSERRGQIPDAELEVELRDRMESDGLEFYDRRGDSHSLHIGSMFADLLVDEEGMDWVPDDTMLLPAVIPPEQFEPAGGVIWQFFKDLEKVSAFDQRPLREYFLIPKESREPGGLNVRIADPIHRLLAVVFAWLEQFEENYREHRGDSFDPFAEEDLDAPGLPSLMKQCEELLEIIAGTPQIGGPEWSGVNPRTGFIPLQAREGPSLMGAVHLACTKDGNAYGVRRALRYGDPAERYTANRPTALRRLLFTLTEWGALEERREGFRLVKESLSGEYPFVIAREELKARLGFSDISKQLDRILKSVPGYERTSVDDFLKDLQLKPLQGHIREIAREFVEERWWDRRRHKYKVPERSWPRCIRHPEGHGHSLGATWERIYWDRAHQTMSLICPASQQIARAGFSLNCSKLPYDWIGGDYYIVLEGDPDGPIQILLGDAVGKRQPAAFLVCEIHGYLKKLLMQGGPREPGRLLEELNHCVARPGLKKEAKREPPDSSHFAAEFNDLRLMTMLAAEYNPKERVLSWASAGHAAPLVFRDGQMRSLGIHSSGAQLGQSDCPDYPVSSTHLRIGDLAIFYTDGVFEDLPAFTDQEAESRFKSTALDLIRIASRPSEIVPLLFERLDELRPSRTRQDDATLIALRIEE